MERQLGVLALGKGGVVADTDAAAATQKKWSCSSPLLRLHGLGEYLLLPLSPLHAL
jgi:hypothetical protein